jgi:hypothetical protein
MVLTYTRLTLTFLEDMLPAFSALARSFAGHGYIAGLSKEYFIEDLLWISLTPRTSDRGDLIIPHRPRAYIAPTFSWASTIGASTYENAGSTLEFERKASLQNSFVELENPDDPFGRMRNGWVELRGHFVFADVVTLPEAKCLTNGSGNKMNYGKIFGQLRRADQIPWVNYDTMTDVTELETSLACLMISYDRQYKQVKALVLKASESHKGAYERVGLLWFVQESFFEGSTIETITIY